MYTLYLFDSQIYLDSVSIESILLPVIKGGKHAIMNLSKTSCISP